MNTPTIKLELEPAQLQLVLQNKCYKVFAENVFL